MFFEKKKSPAALIILALALVVAPGCGGGGGGGSATSTTGNGNGGGAGGGGTTTPTVEMSSTSPFSVQGSQGAALNGAGRVLAVPGENVTITTNFDKLPANFTGSLVQKINDFETNTPIAEVFEFATPSSFHGDYVQKSVVDLAVDEAFGIEGARNNILLTIRTPALTAKKVYRVLIAFEDQDAASMDSAELIIEVDPNRVVPPVPAPMPNVKSVSSLNTFVASGGTAEIQVVLDNPTTSTVKVALNRVVRDSSHTVQVLVRNNDQDLPPGNNQTLTFNYFTSSVLTDDSQPIDFRVSINGVDQTATPTIVVGYLPFRIQSIDNAGRPIVANLSNQIVRLMGNESFDYAFGRFDDGLTYDHEIKVSSMSSSFVADGKYLGRFVPTSSAASAQEFVTLGLPVLPADDYVVTYTVYKKTANPQVRETMGTSTSSVFTVAESQNPTLYYHVRDNSAPFFQNTGEIKSVRVVNNQGVLSLSNPVQNVQPSNGHANRRTSIIDSRHDALWEPRQYFNGEVRVSLTTNVSNPASAQTGEKLLGTNTSVYDIVANRNGDRVAVLYRDIAANVMKITLFGNTLVQNGQNLEPEQFGTVTLNIPNFVLGATNSNMIIAPIVGAELIEEIMIFSQNESYGYRVPIENGSISDQTVSTMDIGFRVDLCENSPIFQNNDSVVYVCGRPVNSSVSQVCRLIFSVDNQGNTTFSLSRPEYINNTGGDVTKAIIKYDFAENILFPMFVADGTGRYFLPSGNEREPAHVEIQDPFDSTKVMLFQIQKAVELPGDDMCAILMKAVDSQGNTHNRIYRIDSNNSMDTTFVEHTGVAMHDLVVGQDYFAIIGDRDVLPTPSSTQTVKQSFIEIEKISQNQTSTRLGLTDLIPLGNFGSYAVFDR